MTHVLLTPYPCFTECMTANFMTGAGQANDSCFTEFTTTPYPYPYPYPPSAGSAWGKVIAAEGGGGGGPAVPWLASPQLTSSVRYGRSRACDAFNGFGRRGGGRAGPGVGGRRAVVRWAPCPHRPTPPPHHPTPPHHTTPYHHPTTPPHHLNPRYEEDELALQERLEGLHEQISVHEQEWERLIVMAGADGMGGLVYRSVVEWLGPIIGPIW